MRMDLTVGDELCAYTSSIPQTRRDLPGPDFLVYLVFSKSRRETFHYTELPTITKFGGALSGQSPITYKVGESPRGVCCIVFEHAGDTITIPTKQWNDFSATILNSIKEVQELCNKSL